MSADNERRARELTILCRNEMAQWVKQLPDDWTDPAVEMLGNLNKALAVLDEPAGSVGGPGPQVSGGGEDVLALAAKVGMRYYRHEVINAGCVIYAFTEREIQKFVAALTTTQARRQYYYKVDACKAVTATDPNCICWHDEGTGPLTGDTDAIRAWRDAPQARPDDTFAEWLATEMPAGTVIGDPEWWANRIARQYAVRSSQARPDGGEVVGVVNGPDRGGSISQNATLLRPMRAGTKLYTPPQPSAPVVDEAALHALASKWRELAAESVDSPNAVVKQVARCFIDLAGEMEAALAQQPAKANEPEGDCHG